MPDVNGSGDILEGYLASVQEGGPALSAKLAMHGIGDAYPSRLGRCLEASSDVDAVPQQVVSFDDDIGEIDADPLDDAFARR